MTEDYGCKVCGKHFSEEEDLKSHGDMDHPEFNEMYGEEERKVVGISPLTGKDVYKDVDDADEIDQQEDKPVQSHDDWKKELEGLKDEYSTEDVTDCAICNSTEHPTSEHPVTEQEEITSDTVADNTGKDDEERGDNSPDHEEAEEDEKEDSYKDMLTKKDTLSGFGDYKLEEHPDEGLGYQKGQEEGGADDPLSKVADLAESYRFMSRDKRSTLFESLDFTQRDSAILSGLEWNELTRPIKVEASEAFAKEEEEEKAEDGEDPDVGGNEDEAYEALYNLEKNHASPDYKKKAIECSRCNEKFYNFNDRSVHFNEVHVNGQEYELPDVCPLCNEIIQEPETMDWHMQEQHGAHVPSTFTQTGIKGAMADTDFDSLESHKATEVKWECLDCDQEFDDAGKHQDETGHHNITKKTEEVNESRSASDLREEIRKQKEFINMASFENPLNMGDAEDKLHNLESELESLGGEELEFTETFGDYEVDCDCDKDPNCPKCKGKGTTTWTSSIYQGDEGEGGHQDLDDTTEYPDDPEEEQEKAEEDDYVDDSDNAGEKYVCPDCGEEFNSDEQLEGHQYSYYHGKYKDEGEGEDIPRNEIGGY